VFSYASIPYSLTAEPASEGHQAITAAKTH